MSMDEYSRDVYFYDVDTTDTEAVEAAVEEVQVCASDACADVSVDLHRADGNMVVVEVAGYYGDMNAFFMRWEDLYS